MLCLQRVLCLLVGLYSIEWEEQGEWRESVLLENEGDIKSAREEGRDEKSRGLHEADSSLPPPPLRQSLE